MTDPIFNATLPGGDSVSVLGQGTWGMGERRQNARDEVAALQLGIDLGMTLIDTAEMYGEGGAETVVGTAIAGRRDKVFLVSKVYPHNATRQGPVAACERSLKRLETDRIDLYLLHWRGGTPLAETLEAFEALRREGKIRHWGVSNFDTDDMQELAALPGGEAEAANQVLYNLSRRGIEYDLLPWCRDQRVPVMAYSPIEQGRILRNSTLASVAARRGVTPAQIALSWLLRQEGLIVIPKASSLSHVRENREAAVVSLDEQDLTMLEAVFPAPTRRRPLEML